MMTFRKLTAFCALAIFALLNSARVTCADDSPKNVGILCDRLLVSNSTFSDADYSNYFSKEFRDKLPLDQLLAFFLDLHSTFGQCTSYQVSSLAPHKFMVTMTTDQNFEVTLLLVVDPSTGAFTGLLLNGANDPTIHIQNWGDVGAVFQRLDHAGALSATLMTEDRKVVLNQGSNGVFAIGSTFKLYILGALQKSIAKGQHSWGEMLAIKDEWKSLPSGTMQNLPVGTRVSLLDYATNMISISDNTAADHLLYLLGRDAVEAMLPPMGNQHASLDLPFFSTLEMFKLKWAVPTSETQKYIDGDEATRRSTLASLATVPRTAVGTNGVDMSLPTAIDKLEWFATTEENCKAMLWLASQNSSEVRQVLSKSTPLIPDAGQPSSHWAFAGYKGGSEPGVLSMTYLLESKSGTRACLSMSWNNEAKNVSEYRFFDVVGKTLKFAEAALP